jgi:endonuclease-3 related protein
MPTLDDAARLIRSAQAEFDEQDEADFEGLAPFDTMLAVLLARHVGPARWKAALEGLAQAELLVPDRLARAEIAEISDAVREKGRSLGAEVLAPLKHLARWLVDHHDGRVDPWLDPDRSLEGLRDELAGIRGIGITGADALLLYALKRPSCRVDRASFRILVRHDWLDPTATYEDARDLLVQSAAQPAVAGDDSESEVLVELAHGLEQLGRRFCRAAAPRCEGCLLERLLPAGGPRGLAD